MTLHEDQAARLDAITEWATHIGSIGDVWKPAEQLVHLRPSATGIRLVDLHPSRPQLDRGKIDGAWAVKEHFTGLLSVPYAGSPGRDTPEKALQSWLIADAYRNARAMSAVTHGLYFVTDEQVLQSGTTTTVCDILAYRKTYTGLVPVLIELKSKRAMSQLVEQLRFSDVIDAHGERFARLYSAILGQPITFAGKCERYLIWPAAPGYPRDPRADELKQQNIHVFAYEPSPPNGFRIRR
jgi:hypothetical protein